MDNILILLGWGLFTATHIGLAMVPVRAALINRLGENRYRGLYSLIAILTFGFLIYSYVVAGSTEVVIYDGGTLNVVFSSINQLLMILAFILLFGSQTQKNPMGMVPTHPEPFGFTRITRHPQNMAFSIFGLAHLLTSKTIADFIFFGGFLIFGIVVSLHQDLKKTRLSETGFDSYIANTSTIPFIAILSGKQEFSKNEFRFGWIVISILVSVIARFLHPEILSKF